MVEEIIALKVELSFCLIFVDSLKLVLFTKSVMESYLNQLDYFLSLHSKYSDRRGLVLSWRCHIFQKESV